MLIPKCIAEFVVLLSEAVESYVTSVRAGCPRFRNHYLRKASPLLVTRYISTFKTFAQSLCDTDYPFISRFGRSPERFELLFPKFGEKNFVCTVNSPAHT